MLSVLIPNAQEPRIEELIAEIERSVPAAEIIVAVDRFRLGKGWALREALGQARGDCIAFIDGDLDIAPRMLKRLLPFLDDFDVVVGSKRIFKAPLHRKIITHLSRIFLRFMFRLQVDTQTGLKLFRREALEKWETNGFAFDVEILAKARKKGLRIIEVPIEAEIKANISWRAVWQMLLETIRLRLML